MGKKIRKIAKKKSKKDSLSMVKALIKKNEAFLSSEPTISEAKKTGISNTLNVLKKCLESLEKQLMKHREKV
jgi:hypothetical protein